MLRLQEVARVDLVDGGAPQRRQVEVAQVLLLAVRRPASIDVRQVVIGTARLRLERTRRPHAREGPAEELGRGRDNYRLPRRYGHDGLPLEEGFELLQVRLRYGYQRAGRRMIVLRLAPDLDRITAIEPAGHAAELLLHFVKLAQGDRQQPIGRQSDAFLGFQFLLEALATEPERGLGAGGQVVLQIRSEEHTSELQSRLHLVCRLLLEKKKTYQPMR